MIRPAAGVARKPPPVLLISIFIVLSTALSPPLLRMFGPDLWQGFGYSQKEWSILVAMRGYVLILFILAAGVLGDLYGRRRVLTIILVGQAILLFAGLFVPDRVTLVVLLSALSVTGAMLQPLAITFLVLHYTGRQRIVALTIYTAVAGLSISLIPVVDNLLLNTRFDWLIFAPPLAVALVGLLLLRATIPESRVPLRPRVINVAVVAIWAAAVCAIVYGALLVIGLGLTSLMALSFLLVGVVGLLLLHYFERRPIVKEWRYQLHRERPLTVAIVAGVVLTLALKTISGQLYYFFKDIQDAGTSGAVLRLLPIIAGAILTSVVVTRITERRGDRVALALGLAALGVATMGLRILQPPIPYLAVAPLLLFTGFGFVLGNSPRLLLLARSVPHHLESTVQAIGVATAQVGGAMAYTMTLGLIRFFTSNLYEQFLVGIGLDQATIDRQLELVEVVTNATFGTVPPEQQATLIASIVPAYETAHTEALARTFLVVGLLCLTVALIVYLGTTEKDMDAAPVSLPPDEDVVFAGIEN